MMNKKINFFIILVTFFIFSFIKPLKESHCKWWASGIGGVAGVISGGLMLNKSFKKKLNLKDFFISSGVGTGIGVLIGYIIYKILLSYTPEARYFASKNIVRNIFSDEIIGSNFCSEDLLIKCIIAKFGTSWPLVLARNYFEFATCSLKNARVSLDKARKEIKNDPSYSKLLQKIKDLEENIKILIDLITERMSLLISHPDYKFQVKLYEKHIKEIRKREHETKERDKDRVLTYYIHSSKINEKGKDRQSRENIRREEIRQKERILENNPHIPASVNVNFN
ncbi:hypothetical protein GF322_01855 [Candidatus Dependentiae bacterium]|nr:hypothetical protein [Candidatus Dependentiae bacterium]